MFCFQLASFKMERPLIGLVSSNGASECVMTDHKTRIIVTLDLDSRNDKFAIWGCNRLSAQLFPIQKGSHSWSCKTCLVLPCTDFMNHSLNSKLQF